MYAAVFRIEDQTRDHGGHWRRRKDDASADVRGRIGETKPGAVMYQYQNKTIFRLALRQDGSGAGTAAKDGLFDLCGARTAGD